MRNKLINELKSLAHEILSLQTNDDLTMLRKKTEEIYDKLVILDYLTENINTLENDSSINQIEEKFASDVIEESENQLINEIVNESESNEVEENITDELENKSNYSEEIENIGGIDSSDLDNDFADNADDFEELFEPKFDSIKEDFSLKDEFKDTVSLDETENLFDTKKSVSKPVSLNDKLLNKNIQIGLNDRIAFVNNLFNFNQTEFNYALNELNSFETEIEAKNYIENNIKTKYNWIGKEDIEERFNLLIERKFL
jgi:hypothetical protein